MHNPDDFHPCPSCPQDFTTAEDLAEHRKTCVSQRPEPKQKRKGTGDSFEAIVRNSAALLKKQGLSLRQTTTGVRGRVGYRGRISGHVMGKADLDFVGDYRGRAVSFDAKSTKIKTSFPLKNIEHHQAKLVEQAYERGALAFFLVEFSTLDGGPRYFALAWPILRDFWKRYRNDGTPASIPLITFKAHCLEVERVGKVLDLVACVRALLEQMDAEVRHA